MDFHYETFKVGRGVRHVIRDDCLFAGTKQRVATEFLRRTLPGSVTTLLYTSSFNGYGPVATAYAAKELGLKCLLVLSLKAFGQARNSTVEEANKSTSVKKCRELGAKVTFASTWGDMNATAKQLESESVFWLPLGFKDNLFENLLSETFSPLQQLNPKRIWVVGGTGTLARALAKAFPSSTVFVVPTDKAGKSFPKLVDYVSSLKNVSVVTQSVPVLETPYPTVKGYDSKAWDAAVALGRSGDFVWNVAE